MGQFTLSIKFDTLDHSPRAHRQAVEYALAQVAQAVGSGVDTEGDVVTPSIGAVPRRTIGRWELIED